MNGGSYVHVNTERGCSEVLFIWSTHEQLRWRDLRMRMQKVGPFANSECVRACGLEGSCFRVIDIARFGRKVAESRTLEAPIHGHSRVIKQVFWLTAERLRAINAKLHSYPEMATAIYLEHYLDSEFPA